MNNAESKPEEDVKMTVVAFLDSFTHALKVQLLEDEQRWGDTWLKRSPKGQEIRIRAAFDNYFDQFEATGQPVPWLKIAGNAMIAWIREEYPQYWE